MKRKWLWLVAALSMLFFTFAAHAESVDAPSGTLIFPPSIKIIENGAFQGIAARRVVLPNGAMHIGERAFADSLWLEAVYIPPSVKHIGDAAFNSAEQVTIYGVSGSSADDWAKENGYRFIQEDIWISSSFNISQRERPVNLSRGAVQDEQSLAATALKGVGADMRFLTCPKEKPEMYPLDYDFP